MSSSRRYSVLLLTLCSIAVACAGCTSQPGTTGALSAKHVPRTIYPLAHPLRALVVRGELGVRDRASKPWQQLEAGETITDVVGLRARRGDAMVELGTAGRLWLAAGAQLTLGQHSPTDLRFEIVRGDARISLFDPAIQATLFREGRKPTAISGKDVLIQRASVVRETARVAQAADWTLALVEADPPAPAGVGSLRAGNEALLQLRSVRIEATTGGDMAETRVEHIFYNSSEERLEGTFRFPLPEGAALVGLALEIDGKLVEGELVERQKARRVYQSIVDAMQDPALLEWEQGNIFKLRVFPIEPRSAKRVVLRYVAPLSRNGDQLAFVYPTAAPELETTIPRFTVTLDGKTIVETKDFQPGQRIIGRITDGVHRRAMQEQRDDGTYTALRLRPDWSQFLGEKKSSTVEGRNLILVVDTSRSALESRELGLQSVRTLLAGLREHDRFLLLASDLTVRAHADSDVAATKANIATALAFLSAIDYDGATDLARALKVAGERARALRESNRFTQLVYIGDGTPTWGETDGGTLEALAAQSLGDIPLHSIILGKGANARWLERLSAGLGGRAVAPRGLRDIRRLALQLSIDHATPRLRQVRVRAGESDELFPAVVPTLFPGDELVVLIRTPPGATPAKAVVIEGRVGVRRLRQTLLSKGVTASRHVAHRWARYRLEKLQTDQADPQAIVAHSLQYGLLSRHTAFLVLESEEAYRRFDIARRKKTVSTELNQPTVTGADLENIAGQRAGLSPDRFQPGDPEVRIPAPADARSVVVVFPFGETKVARYEPSLEAWTVRFLVPQTTAEGRYAIAVRITHADGRVEILELSYVIDTAAPLMEVRIRERGSDYLIVARQKITQHELLRAARDEPSAPMLADDNDRFAQVVQDAHRVEARLPDGRLLRFWRDRHGVFSARWRPQTALQGPVTLTFIAVDIANNKRVFALSFDPRSGALTPIGEAHR
jgi:Mg-chelatase subunit ChlD